MKEWLVQIESEEIRYYAWQKDAIKVIYVTDNMTSLVGQSRVKARVQGSGPATWRLQIRTDLGKIDGDWKTTKQSASIYQVRKGDMITNVVIISATGSLGRSLREELEGKANYKVVFFSRRAESLALASNEKVINGSATSGNDLNKVLVGQGIVFVALSSDLSRMAREIVASVKRAGAARIVFASSVSIHGEVAGEPRGVVAPTLKPYHKAADTVGQSGLDHTILRPGWLDSGQDGTCQTTQKSKTLHGHDASCKAIVTLVRRIIDQSKAYFNTSPGLYR